ncbi:MFS transporter, OFA family, oxalate/formate antiporter [Entomortierella parvispora]|uniref:MFS transporter, OFA family, oxalate/formate antiporter n=1 Tax=Entomortierella parvispora TaxID=205924 RepID=A0A9P3HH65_9FUNG|nr:MFS transporter, OFA family, oxalate/formate antiporter [Entomortierella parvispora]
MTDTTTTKGGVLGFIKNHYNDTRLRRSDAQIEREKRYLGMPFNRWLMFPAAFLFQAICGSLYAWSVFNDPIDGELYGLGADKKPKQHNAAVTFYIAIGFFGFSAAVNGPWLERVGPRTAALVGTTLFFIGNMIAAIGIHTKVMGVIYFGYGVIGGTGLGLSYISPVSALQKWFPDRRGLAGGFAVCGFGAGSIALAKVPGPLKAEIGLTNTFITLGCIYFGIMLFCCFIFRVPPPGFTVNGLDVYRNKVDENGDVEAFKSEKSASNIRDPSATMSLSKAILSREYLLIYLMFFGNEIAGLVVLSRLSNMVVDIFGKDASTGATIVAINGGFNLFGRLAFAVVSDKFGRKNCYIIMLVCQVVALGALPTLMANKNYPGFLALIWILTACYGGGFGCIPAFLCDMFGPSNIGAMHGIILTAWSIAGIAGGLLFTALYNNLINNEGYTAKDYWIYGINLRWLVGIAAFGLLVVLFVRTTIRDRLLPSVPGEFTRIRFFGRLIRIGTFGVKFVSKQQEQDEWDRYVDSRPKTESTLQEVKAEPEKYGGDKTELP